MARTRQAAKATRPRSSAESQDNNETAETSADSQESANEQITRLVDSMRKSTKKRREAQRKTIEADFMKNAEAMENRIENSFGKIEKSKSSKAKIEQLKVLFKKRIAIEEKIFAHLTKLERAYNSANRELIVILHGRAEDTKKLLETDCLKGP
ncbi:hypothetical protein MMC14_001287 [Varicellaria rhodocarpa]|nr:hypothetical protein [Varicellaria rhodocarpa]